MEHSEWLKGLKAGDKVIVESDTLTDALQEHVLHKVTPTGRFVVDHGNYKQNFDSTGREMGNTYHAARLLEPTPERYALMARRKLVRKIQRGVELGVVGRLTDEELAAVWAVIGKYPFQGRFEKKP